MSISHSITQSSLHHFTSTSSILFPSHLIKFSSFLCILQHISTTAAHSVHLCSHPGHPAHLLLTPAPPFTPMDCVIGPRLPFFTPDMTFQYRGQIGTRCNSPLTPHLASPNPPAGLSQLDRPLPLYLLLLLLFLFLLFTPVPFPFHLIFCFRRLFFTSFLFETFPPPLASLQSLSLPSPDLPFVQQPRVLRTVVSCPRRWDRDGVGCRAAGPREGRTYVAWKC